MNITKKKLVELRHKIIELRKQQSNSNNLIEQKLGDLSREILDILDPPKKGYLRFPTSVGWVQFKKPRKQKSVRKNEF